MGALFAWGRYAVGGIKVGKEGESTGFYRNYRGGCGRIGSRFGVKYTL